MTLPALVLYQPDIPGNTGAVLRLGACFGMDVHVIHPTGFELSHKSLRRAGMDYLEMARLTEHVSHAAFEEWRTGLGRRLVLATTRGAVSCHRFDYRHDDLLLFGRESAGVPEAVHEAADARIHIPMRPGARSLNLALSVAVIAGECLRRFGAGPGSVSDS